MGKEQKSEVEREKIILNLISEYRKLGYSTEHIKEKFKKKDYSKELINKCLKINEKEVKMEEEYKDLDDEELESEENDLGESDVDKDVKNKDVKNKDVKDKEEKVKPEKAKEKEPTSKDIAEAIQTLGQAVNELNKRLESVESSLYRIRNL